MDRHRVRSPVRLARVRRYGHEKACRPRMAVGQAQSVEIMVTPADLAGPALPHVKARTLLIVGGEDTVVERLNREALERMRCPKRLAIVPGASHLFEEPGALEEVSRLARDWFEEYVRTG